MSPALKWVSAAKWIGAIALGYWAAFPITIHILVIFMGLDFVTGVVRAGVDGILSSAMSLKGLMKKIGIVCAVLFVHLLDGYVLPAYGWAPMELGLEKIFAIYLSMNEAISIVENLSKSGVRFPISIINALAVMKQISGRTATREEIDARLGDQPK